MLFRRLISFLLVYFLFFASSMAWAEDLALPGGTQIPFSFLENGTSKTLEEAEHVPITVTEDVVILGANGLPELIFKKGQEGYAEIFSVHPPVRFGVAGRIAIHLVYIRDVYGKEHKLRFDLRRSKRRNPLTYIVPLPAVPIAWAVKGKNVRLYDEDNNHFEATALWNYPIKTTSNQGGSTVSDEPAKVSVVSNESTKVLTESAKNESSESPIEKIINRVQKGWQPPRQRKSLSGEVTYLIDSQGNAVEVKNKSFV